MPVTTKTQHSTAPISGINTVTIAENRNPKSPSAGERENYGAMENYSARNREEPLTPATCHLRGLMDAAWQGERAPIRGSNGLRFHSMTCRRRPHQRTRGEVGGCLRPRWVLWGDELLFRAWSDGTLRPCQEVQKCTLKKKKNKFYDVYVYLNMQKPMPKAHKKKSLKSEVRFPLSALGSAGEIAPSTVGQSLGGRSSLRRRRGRGSRDPSSFLQGQGSSPP